ncbi:MAG: hypothetical protein MZV64_38620 [Ignavibacteriales bacterium]|nr:hypothetical protein [Ignavibacteriales bacterium]
MKNDGEYEAPVPSGASLVVTGMSPKVNGFEGESNTAKLRQSGSLQLNM